MSTVTAFQLVMGRGPQPGQIFEFPPTIVNIGRDPGNHVVVNDPQVSRHHARITPQGTMFVLEDLGSTNGTTVNGMPVTGPVALTHGDEIGLGDNITLVFYGVSAADADRTVISPGARPAVAQPAPPPTAGAPSEWSPPAEYAAYPAESLGYYEEQEGRNWLIVGLGCLLTAIIVTLLFALWLYFLAPASIVDPIADFFKALGIDVCRIVTCG